MPDARRSSFGQDYRPTAVDRLGVWLSARQIRRQVGALVHRSGKVDYVVVGDASRLVLPDIGRLRAAEGRFRALRLVHTHLHGEPLTRDDLVDLVRLRLDLIATVQRVL